MSYIGKQPRKAALTASDIEDGIITAAKIEDGAVVAAEIASNAVTTAKINADAVTGAKIADDAINSEHYTNGSIDTAHIAADQIVGSLIADNAIDSEHYTDGSIDTAHIAADQITNAKIADDQIDSEHYVDGSIDTAHIADVNVTQGKIADQAINEAKIQISNAPTNGYVLSAQSGNTGGLTWAEAGGGSLNKLITTTLSSAASSIDFDATYINSTYKNYFLIGYILPSTDNVTLRNRLYVNGSADANAQYGFGSAALNNSQYQTDNSNGHFQLGHTAGGNASGEGVTFHEYLHNPMSTAISTGVTGMVTFKNTGGNQESSAFSGSKVAVQANNGISFLMNSGNIAAGSYVTLYGITD